MPAVADLVHETSTSTGTGSFTLAAVDGKQRFSTAFSTGSTTNVFYYFISNRNAAEWEAGTGHMAAATTLVRDTIIASSNANAAVDFTAGTKDVANDIPASIQAPLIAANGSALALQSSLDALVLTTSVLALQVADNANAALFPDPNNVFDSFAALTYVDVSGASNLDTGTVGVLKPSTTSDTRITGATPSSPNFGGNAANINDNNTGTSMTTATIPDLTAASAVGSRIVAMLDFGSVRPVSGIQVVNARQSAGGSADGFSVWYSSDASTWTQLGAAQANGTTPVTFERTGWVSARYAAFVLKQTNWGVTITLSDLNAYSPGTTSNLTVRSTSYAALSAPATMKGIIRVKEVDAATAGSDYTLEFSRDGGTTWTAATLTELFTSPSPTASIRVCQTNDVDVSGQPPGTSPCWRFKTLNNKMVELHDVGLYWG